MNWPENRALEVLSSRDQRNDGGIPTTVERFALNLWDAPLGQTNVCEVAFQRIRAAERRDHADSQRMRAEGLLIAGFQGFLAKPVAHWNLGLLLLYCAVWMSYWICVATKGHTHNQKASPTPKI